jgi:hypothetical protein
MAQSRVPDRLRPLVEQLRQLAPGKAGGTANRRGRRYAPRMSPRTQDLLRSALLLPLDERAEFAAELLASMDGEPDADVDTAWAAELERRAERALSGDSASVDWTDVHAEALRRIEGK